MVFRFKWKILRQKNECVLFGFILFCFFFFSNKVLEVLYTYIHCMFELITNNFILPPHQLLMCLWLNQNKPYLLTNTCTGTSIIVKSCKVLNNIKYYFKLDMYFFYSWHNEKNLFLNQYLDIKFKEMAHNLRLSNSHLLYFLCFY